jgi:hypothetical protein
MSGGLPRFSGLVWIGLAACAAMAIGAFGPWAKAIGLVNTSIGGTDGSNDGWLVVAAAVAGAFALLLHARGVQGIGAIGALLAGAGGAFVAIHDRGNVTDTANEKTSDLVTLQVGWGLNLAMGAAIGLGVVGFVALLGARTGPAATHTEVEDPAHRECPHGKESMRRDAGTCPHCRKESPAWTFHEGRWWVQNEAGAWSWLDEGAEAWRQSVASAGSVVKDSPSV